MTKKQQRTHTEAVVHSRKNDIPFSQVDVGKGFAARVKELHPHCGTMVGTSLGDLAPRGGAGNPPRGRAAMFSQARM